MSSSSSTKVCFNSSCKDALEWARKGWRRRTGEFADLCDRCASAYEEGKFCEAFHLNASGWRCCESCGKTPNPAWPPPSLFLPVPPERTKDLSTKNWCPIAGSDPVPWRQAPSLLTSTERLSASSFEKNKLEDSYERLVNGSQKLGAADILENGNAGISCGEQVNPSINMPHKSPFSNNDTSTSRFSVAVSPNKASDQTKVSNSHAPRPTPLQLMLEYEISYFLGTGPGFLLKSYRKYLESILQFYVVLFLRLYGYVYLMTSAYFPPISQPEGLPLKVQDSKGKEWIFQFRFWPNNNSRMYVLEGVTPCIQSMQLQAGDIVTFSWMEPEGKLVMGFRKASTAPPSDQGSEPVNASNGVSTNGDISARKIKTGEVLSKTHPLKGKLVTSGYLPNDLANSADQASPWSKDVKSECISKEVLGAKSSFRGTKKNSTLGSKSKRLRIEKEDVIQLKLTWEQAQGLLRPPPNHVPSVVVIDGFEFEEYEDAPIIGRPTIFAADHLGSSCSAAQELTAEQLEELLPVSNRAASKKMKSSKQEPDSVDLEGLDALADLAIQEEGEGLDASSQATTKHPRHRPGCSCIVCIQPPSGKGPKHKQTCTCNVCLMVKAAFPDPVVEEREETVRERSRNCTAKVTTASKFSRDNVRGQHSDNYWMRSSTLSPFKGQIDLNIQPERDEELSPGSYSDGVMTMLQDATERDHMQQRFSSSNNQNCTDQTQVGGNGVGVNFGNSIIAFHRDPESEHPEPLSANAHHRHPISCQEITFRFYRVVFVVHLSALHWAPADFVHNEERFRSKGTQDLNHQMAMDDVEVGRQAGNNEGNLDQESNEESKTVHNAKTMKELRAQMDLDVEQVLKKVKIIKKRLEALDQSSADHRKLPGCGPGSSTDRTRVSVVSGLGKKLKDMMDDFQGLRGKMATEYKETVERRYFTITGEKANEETIENLIATGESESFLQKEIQEQGRGQILDTISEIQERHDAVKEIEKNLLELHQVFLDMAALVEAQGHQLNNIESHMAHASSFVKRGNEQLQEARVYQKSFEEVDVHRHCAGNRSPPPSFPCLGTNVVPKVGRTR
ncbi:syntaxin of plants 125 [Actinidia rufa]|uniref:Syntaxin of plants 125 n=1 Tax=Actinidia rufa TaxID=165716 RepID=A0A7J0FWP9_9ERIC|nr:syntaxin of plants 125 [Actinidia rufa]